MCGLQGLSSLWLMFHSSRFLHCMYCLLSVYSLLRYLGTRPVKLFKVKIYSSESVSLWISCSCHLCLWALAQLHPLPSPLHCCIHHFPPFLPFSPSTVSTILSFCCPTPVPGHPLHVPLLLSGPCSVQSLVAQLLVPVTLPPHTPLL